MSPTTRNESARRIAPIHIVVDRDVILNASVERAWPYILDYQSWQDYPSAQHISGEPGQEGEVVLLSKEGVSYPFYARTVLIERERRVIWKVYPAEDKPAIDFFGIVEFHLFEEDGKTRLHNHGVYEFLVPYQDEAELESFRRQHDEAGEMMNSVYFPRLKSLVEQANPC